jgi:hypothetical protein
VSWGRSSGGTKSPYAAAEPLERGQWAVMALSWLPVDEEDHRHFRPGMVLKNTCEAGQTKKSGIMMTCTPLLATAKFVEHKFLNNKSKLNNKMYADTMM